MSCRRGVSYVYIHYSYLYILFIYFDKAKSNRLKMLKVQSILQKLKLSYKQKYTWLCCYFNIVERLMFRFKLYILLIKLLHCNDSYMLKSSIYVILLRPSFGYIYVCSNPTLSLSPENFNLLVTSY